MLIIFPVSEGQLSSSKAPLTKVVPVERDSVLRTDDVQVLYLTPDQDRCRRFFTKGLLIGPAGTGKTIILRGKVVQLIADGDPCVILYIASKPHDTRMRLYFEGAYNSQCAGFYI